MKRKNLTRNALFTSIISLLLCVSMLVGTTFAWFTDSVASGVNTITAGNLDVELYHGKTPDPTTKVGKDTKLFTDTKDVEIELWEPGVVAYTNLKVANEGNLALKYQMALNFEEAAATADGKTLADVLKVAVVEDGVKGTTRETVLEEAKRSANQFTLDTFYLAEKLEKAENSETYGLVIYWEPDTDYTDGNTDNLYNMNNGETTVLSIKLGIHLFATQLEMEEDSFGPDYDENLWDDAMVVLSEEDLIAALAAGETKIKLEADIALTKALEIPANTNLALNLNGKKISGAFDKNSGAVLTNKGTLTIVGGTIENTTVNGNAAICNEGTLTLADGAKIVGAPIADGSYPAYALNNYGKLTVNTGSSITSDRGALYMNNGSDVVINGGNIAVTDALGSRALTAHVIYAYGSNSKLTINDGTFAMNYAAAGDLGASVICPAGATIYVYDGEFTFAGETGNQSGIFQNYMGYGAPVNVYGGTYNDTTVKKNLAAGYKAIDNNGKYVVVPEKVDGVIATAADLYALRGTGWDGPAVSGTYSLVADIDMTGYDMTPIAIQDGGNLTFLGNGHTISNLNLVEAEINVKTSALFTARLGGTEANISNLTLENVTSTSSKYSAVVFAYSDNGMAINMNNVDVKNATVKGDTAAALIGYTTGAVNLTDCDVSGLNLDGAFDENKVGAFIGTANTATCVVTENECTNSSSYREYGRVLGASVNGVIYNYVADGLYTDDKGNYYVYNANGLEKMNQMMTDDTAGRDVVVNLAADIDFNGKTWTPVDSHVDFGFYLKEFNGNGHTISNLTVNGQAMFTRFSCGAGVEVVIKDITFDKATVKNGDLNTAIVVGHTYNNVLLDNVDVKNSSITGAYKVAPLIGTVYNESTSSITATLKKCDVENVVVTATSYDFCTTGMVAFVNKGDNDTVKFENCTVSNVQLKAKPNGYESHAWIYVNDAETDDCFNEALGVTVTDCTFETI